jgi:hypothetical protein
MAAWAARLPDGAYVIQVVGGRLDERSRSSSRHDRPDDRPRAWTASIDTSPPTVSAVTASASAFSPDSDGRQDATTLKAAAGPGATAWTLRSWTVAAP